MGISFKIDGTKLDTGHAHQSRIVSQFLDVPRIAWIVRFDSHHNHACILVYFGRIKAAQFVTQ
jgi:hypothetical protein